MKRILKFQVPFAGVGIMLATTARVVRVGLQDDVTHIWVENSKGNGEQTHTRRYYVIGTGEEFRETDTCVGSYTEGPFVWHVIERIER